MDSGSNGNCILLNTRVAAAGNRANAIGVPVRRLVEAATVKTDGLGNGIEAVAQALTSYLSLLRFCAFLFSFWVLIIEYSAARVWE